MNRLVPFKPFFFLTLTALFLFALSFIPADTELGPVKLKEVDFLIDIKPDVESASLPCNLDDSRDIASLSVFNDLSYSEYNPFSTPLTGNLSQLQGFFTALKNAKSSVVRIAHYGDSNIEGDNITADLRESLQDKFGGKGIGFMNITAQDVSFRSSITHSFSNDWKVNSIIRKNFALPAPVGISGFVFVPVSGSWVKYESSWKYKNSRTFKTARVFYSNSDGSSIKYSIDNGPEQTANLTKGATVQELTINSDKEFKSIKITATKEAQANFYGVSLENGNGVYVDNFALRGQSGTTMKDINPTMLSQFSKDLNYSLIILSFGNNVLDNQDIDMNKYADDMIKVVNQLKQAFPKAGIILTGAPDKSQKKGSSNYITHPRLKELIAAQKKVVESTGVALWNTFEAMGGENSMTSWVNSSPPLGTKDFTHFTAEGYKKIATMLYEAIIQKAN